MATFLLEVRTEEIPANALPGARRQLGDLFKDRLTDAGYSGCEVRVLSTSRRLIARVSRLEDRQPNRSERLTGPPRSIAFAADGSPTKAAEGFARKAGVSVDQLEIESTPKGEYLAASVVHEGRETREILAEMVPEIVGALRFPKMMRWGLGDYEFVRPVHGILALLDDQVVPLELYGVRGARRTVGHRVHAPDAFEIPRADAFERELDSRQVMVDPDDRRSSFTALADALVSELGCRVHPDDALVAEHVELVEYPGLLLGSFSERFLELPREVVVTTLRHHQKCLVLERPSGVLAPHFLAVVDRRDDPEGLVRQGNEWVITARLADAGFFFSEDRKRRLAELVPDLERLEFHRRLGSVAAKVERVAKLGEWIGEQVSAEVEPELLRRAPGLVKADLLTHMVGEFPELQGVMGGHYLRLEGEPEELWTAARDHYLPLGFEGDVPASMLGRIVAAADRLDTVVSLFGAGEVPSGSRDPHGLRRAAQSFVRIVAESGWVLDLSEAIEAAVELVEDLVETDPLELADSVSGFLAERVKRYLTDVVGSAFDTADAVMAADWHRMAELIARARALETARSSPEFRALGLAFKRVRNITDGQPDSGVDPGLFEAAEERELYDGSERFRERLEACLAGGRFSEAFDAMAELAGVLDRFFDEVLVMADDDAIRSNRIGVLKALGRDFLTLADLSRLQIEGGDG